MTHLLLVVLMLFTASLLIRLMGRWTEPPPRTTWLRRMFRAGFRLVTSLVLVAAIGFEIWLLIEWAGPLPEPTFLNTAVVFGTALAIMHLLVIVRFGGRDFWTFIEYTWLFLATVSILGAVSEYRRTSASDRLPMARASERWRWEAAVKSADEGVRLTSLRSRQDLSDVLGSGDIYDAWDPGKLKAALAEERAWFTEARTVLDEGRDWHWWRRYLTEEFVSRNLGKVDSERRKLLESLRRIAELQRELGALAVASERTETEKMAFTLLPWLLAAGLAMRIGRVSAGVRGLY